MRHEKHPHFSALTMLWLQRLLFCMAIALSACSTPGSWMEQVQSNNNPPVASPGLQSLLTQPTAAQVLHVFIVHGIGDQTPGYSKELVSALIQRLNLTPQGEPIVDKLEKSRALYAANLSPDMAEKVKTMWPTSSTKKTKSLATGTQVEFHEFLWASLANLVADCHISHDQVVTFANTNISSCATKKSAKESPAKLNALAQDLIRTHLADTLTYTGDFGGVIRAALQEKLCNAMDLEVTITTKANQSPELSCDLSKSSPRFAFITHSLGSKIVTDMLTGLDKDFKLPTNAEQTRTPIFMLANQLTLLSISNMCQAAKCDPSEMAQVLKPHLFSPKASANTASWIDIVAYNDPNDLLSFEIPSNTYVPDKVRAWNITTGNASEVLGLVANPITAHTGYWVNPIVSYSIACGALPVAPAQWSANEKAQLAQPQCAANTPLRIEQKKQQ